MCVIIFDQNKSGMGSVVGWGKVIKMYGALLTKEGLKMTTQGNFNGFVSWLNWVYMLGLGKAIATRTFVVNQKDPGWFSAIFWLPIVFGTLER